jgi:hypothetical protein
MSSAGRPTATSSSGSTPSTNLRCRGVPLARLIRSHLARRIQHGRDVTPLPGRRVGRGASIHVMSSRHSSLWRCRTSTQEKLKPRFRPRPHHVAGAIAQAKHGTFAGTGGEVAASPLRSYLSGNPEVLRFAPKVGYGWKVVLRLDASGGGVDVCAERADPTWLAVGSFADARPIVPIDDLWWPVLITV